MSKFKHALFAIGALAVCWGVFTSYAVSEFTHAQDDYFIAIALVVAVIYFYIWWRLAKIYKPK